MKKIILLSILIFTLISCSDIKSPKDKLIAEAESTLKKSMNDPYSYEFVSLLEDLQKETESNLNHQELESKGENEDSFRYYKLTYRGKNKMGALILDDVYVISDNNLSFIGLENIEN